MSWGGLAITSEPHPSTRYGWRHQIKPWVELGYRVVVPDKLGYGGSEQPEDAVHYTPKRITDDIAALMDLLQIPKAVSLFALDINIANLNSP